MGLNLSRAGDGKLSDLMQVDNLADQFLLEFSPKQPCFIFL